MDFLQKIGGRKFLMALIAVGIATFIELKGATGLSTTMAAFLGSIVAAFSVANNAATKSFLATKNGGKPSDSGVSEKLDKILEANDPEKINELAGILSDLSTGINEVKVATGQIGTLVGNIGKAVQSR